MKYTDAASPTPESAPVDPNVLELDFAFEILDNSRRRYLLYALGANRRWTLAVLATKLVAWERGTDEMDVDRKSADRMYTSLYHVHVPKLVDHGIVQFKGKRTIARTDDANQVFAILERVGASLDSELEKHASRKYLKENDT